MRNPYEMPEELTTAMHSTFEISEESDRMFRVWAAMGITEEIGSTYSLDEALALQQVTREDYEKFKDSRPLPG